ncbi:helix-turn-helix transcriptional regulator [Cryomorpha ignava]|uniref:Helix-turn-helix transcriptional regulator n=1 Tax=Cryomorpha ignava TaxID=101383 RepID=A0A7K3WYS5_9FLAO|nr:helix-turn-helix transcriptional regulator [Cryomorpha ignava]NEN25835.1 helix-turn-helix transcriptional regulator [Cryomorpha ignava]
MEKVLLNEEMLSEIRDIRRSKEYSQEYMAVAMGISQNSYNRLVTGQTKMTIDKPFLISRLLEIQVYSERETDSYRGYRISP